MKKRQHFQSGFTLLELILALGISIVIIGAIASSIYVSVSTLTLHQKEIEQKQVGRNVIAMVSSDLRAALQYKPVDVSGLENLVVSQAMIAGITPSGDEEEGSGDGEAGDGGDEEEAPEGGNESGTSSEAPMDPEECVSCRPTLIGTETVLMIDISRLPRVDEYNPLVATRTDPQLPSDVKGVSYFIGEPNRESGAAGRNSMFSDEVQQLGGLYRRQIDRAVAAFAGEEGAVSNVDDYTELLAPEIPEIRFRYFNGTDWQSTWDSVEEDGFPLAIEVIVVIDPKRSQSVAGDYQYGGFDFETMQQIRQVIHLPIAEMPEEK